MQLEDYFDFNTEPAEHIRIKGTRIDIDFVIEFHKRHMTPEQIAVQFGCPLTVEQAYAAVLYYLHNKADVDAYLARREARWRERRQADVEQLPEVATRLRAIKASRSTVAPSEAS